MSRLICVTSPVGLQLGVYVRQVVREDPSCIRCKNSVPKSVRWLSNEVSRIAPLTFWIKNTTIGRQIWYSGQPRRFVKYKLYVALLACLVRSFELCDLVWGCWWGGHGSVLNTPTVGWTEEYVRFYTTSLSRKPRVVEITESPFIFHSFLPSCLWRGNGCSQTVQSWLGSTQQCKPTPFCPLGGAADTQFTAARATK